MCRRKIVELRYMKSENSASGSRLVEVLMDRDVVIDLCFVFLGDALRNPHNVSALLLLKKQSVPVLVV
jgi:hypothetical protein